MTLEFALRPRFDLERPTPRRRQRRARLPPLALPIVAYWLAMAGVTHALLRVAAEDTAEGTLPSSRTSSLGDAWNAATSPSSPPLERDIEPAPPGSPLEPAFEPGPSRPASEPDFGAEPRAAAAPAAEPKLELSVAKVTKRPEPATRRQPEARPERPALRRAESRPERPAPPALVEEPLPRRELPEPPVSREPNRDEAPASALPSCESVAASANQTIDLEAAPAAPDLTRDAFASVLENGAYLARCAIPSRTALEICAAIRDGKVVGVSVRSEPQSPAVNACVRRAVAGLRFARSPRLDVTRTRFEKAR
jgi:hypothetical protein